MEKDTTENSAASHCSSFVWQSTESMPKSGSFLIGVWEGEWRDPKQNFRVYVATGFPSGPVWGRSYRTVEGEAYEVVGWMVKPPAPDEDCDGDDVDKDEEYRLRDANHARNEARSEIVDKLRGLKRHSVGSEDEGGGYMYVYADESKDGRWVEWDDVQKLIDDLVRFLPS